MRIRVNLQHFRTHGVDDTETAVPESLFTALHEKRFERVRDLVAHVRVGQVEAGQEGSLQFVRGGQLRRYHVPAQHVNKDHVSRRDKALVLPPLEQERAVHAPEPQNRVGGRQVLETVASTTEELAQTLEQLAGGSLDDHPLGGAGAAGGAVGGFLHRGGGVLVGGQLVDPLGRRLCLGEGGEIGAGKGFLQVLVVENWSRKKE